jgi:tetratricopeptide (TPR) repeat protein
MVGDLIEKGQSAEAYTILVRLEAQETKNPELLYQLGLLFLALGKLIEAERCLKTATAIDSDDFHLRAEAQYQLGLALVGQRRAEEAVAAFRESCTAKPDFAMAHLHWGLTLASMGNLNAAGIQYGQVIQINPRLVAAHYHMALAKLGLRQYNQALEAIEEACKIDSSVPQLYNVMGETFLAMNEFQSAALCFAKSCQLDATFALAQYNWGVCLVKLEQLEEACIHFRAALSSNAKPLSAQRRALIYNDWGVALYKLGHLEEAAEKTLEAVDVDPNFQQAKINLASIHLCLKEYELALSSLQDLLASDPASWEINMYCGIALLFNGRSAEALERLLTASQQIQSNPDGGQDSQLKALKSFEPFLKMWIAYAYLAMHDVQAALSQFEQVYRQEPNNVLALDGIGSCLELLGEHDKAIEAFSDAVKIDPSSASVHIHLSRAYAAAGRKDLSKQHYREALTIDSECLSQEREIVELLFSRAKFDLVIDHSLSILDVHSNDSETQLLLAAALKTQSRLEEALTLINDLIRQEPENIAARSLAGQIFMQRGNFVEADEMFRMAAAVHEKAGSLAKGADSAMFTAWGQTLASLGFYELALEKYATASEIDPYDSNTYEAWGETLKTLGRFSEAAEVFKRASGYL